jgi:hypothetical protein
MNPVAIPTKNAGEVYIPALGKTFQQIELREDDVYDTILVSAAAQAAGTEYIYFRDITNKNEQDCNLPNSRRIQAGDEAAVFRIGLHPRECVGNTLPAFNDYRRIFGSAHLEVKFNRRIITTGPAIKYPSGYGMAGFSDETGATAVSIGVPSVAAAPTLFVPQQLKDDDDLQGKLRFPDAQWISGYTVPTIANTVRVSLLLHGVLKNPLGK